jgi:hypothetical protein
VRGRKASHIRYIKCSRTFVVIPGDVAYNEGSIANYRANFFPVYNADERSAADGAPLMRSIPFIAGLEQHDLQEQYLLKEVPDGFAYFIYWSMPWNGPDLRVGGQKA